MQAKRLDAYRSVLHCRHARWHAHSQKDIAPHLRGHLRGVRPCSYARQSQLTRRVSSPLTCRASTGAAQKVLVEVEKAGRNVRVLFAGIDIDAPIAAVWQALTDYDGLGDFIPGLAENRCLEKRVQGAKLLQIGQQEIALGAKFKATVVLDCQEYLQGVPENLCSRMLNEPGRSGVSTSASLFPEPRSEASNGIPQDIAFSMLEGDFLAFRGIWRMQKTSPSTTRLSYALHVQPKPWLPVRLIQNRITKEIAVNLNAVRQHSEQMRIITGSCTIIEGKVGQHGEGHSGAVWRDRGRLIDVTIPKQ